MGKQLKQIEEMARERSMKSGRTFEKEYSDLLSKNPQVYSEYLAENPAQTNKKWG